MLVGFIGELTTRTVPLRPRWRYSFWIACAYACASTATHAPHTRATAFAVSDGSPFRYANSPMRRAALDTCWQTTPALPAHMHRLPRAPRLNALLPNSFTRSCSPPSESPAHAQLHLPYLMATRSDMRMALRAVPRLIPAAGRLPRRYPRICANCPLPGVALQIFVAKGAAF